MEKIKQIFISVLLSTSILCSQSYTVSVLGYHIADLKKTNQSSGNINFEFQTRGLVDFFYPTENKYTTKYDNETFQILL